MKEIFKLNGYIGQKSWLTSTSAFSIGTRLNLNIINTHFTELYLNRMLLFIYNIALAKGHIIFVTNQNSQLIVNIANKLNASYSINRWIGGTLTNWKQLSTSKKQIGLTGTFPSLMIVINPEANRNAIHEANILQIPVIALVDSGTSTKGIDYYIPANDLKITYMVLDLITKAIQLAQKQL